MSSRPRPGATVEARIVSYAGGTVRPRFDDVATEEPLEIRLRAGGLTRTAAVTMRTPGSDFELAAGFVLAEGVITSARDVLRISYCLDRTVDIEQRYNIVNVDLSASCLPQLDRLERHFVMNSACGVCGTASIDALRDRCFVPVSGAVTVEPATIVGLSGRLRDAQRIFRATGGLHAAALFTPDGHLVAVREDIGRHNAFDKLVGWAVLEQRLPLSDGIVFLSGRASYELVQKAIAARIPVVCAVSAPSSLAVDLARAFGVTLIGFVRDDRFNVYSGGERVTPPDRISA